MNIPLPHLRFLDNLSSIPEVHELVSKLGEKMYNGMLCAECKNGNLERVRLLLDKGANIHSNDDEPLRNACENGNLEIVRLLLDKCGDIHALNDEPLRKACKNGHLEIVRLLLDKGASVNAQNYEALTIASRLGHISIKDLLLEALDRLIKRKSDCIEID